MFLTTLLADFFYSRIWTSETVFLEFQMMAKEQLILTQHDTVLLFWLVPEEQAWDFIWTSRQEMEHMRITELCGRMELEVDGRARIQEPGERSWKWI